jgi:hypothetical protein
MEVNLYCIWCGGRLGVEGDHIICLACDTEYSNILLSESETENESAIIVERSISFDCSLTKLQKTTGREIQIQPEEVAVICT